LKIAVTGANSSVGLELLRHLREQEGAEVVACVRSERAAAAIPASAGVQVRVASYDDRGALTECLAGAACAVHLAGILLESRGTSYESANVDTTVAVAEAAVQAGVGHLVLVSVVGADAESRNRYFRTKGLAERAFAESGVPATIVRTPILLGPGTAGAFALARTVGRGRAQLLGGGRYVTRPLDVDDLCEAIVRICSTRPKGVMLHELVGPEPVTYRALVGRAAEVAGTRIALGSIPIWLAKAGAAVRSKFAGGGFTPTVIDVITKNEVVEKNADAELGITLTPLDVSLRRILPGKGRGT
jgi:NADH dehydrogenase